MAQAILMKETIDQINKEDKEEEDLMNNLEEIKEEDNNVVDKWEEIKWVDHKEVDKWVDNLVEEDKEVAEEEMMIMKNNKFNFVYNIEKNEKKSQFEKFYNIN